MNSKKLPVILLGWGEIVRYSSVTLDADLGGVIYFTFTVQTTTKMRIETVASYEL